MTLNRIKAFVQNSRRKYGTLKFIFLVLSIPLYYLIVLVTRIMQGIGSLGDKMAEFLEI